MSENKGLGIENLGSVDWLNDSSPTPEAAETQQEQVTEPTEAVAETTEAEAVDPENETTSRLNCRPLHTFFFVAGNSCTVSFED